MRIMIDSNADNNPVADDPELAGTEADRRTDEMSSESGTGSDNDDEENENENDSSVVVFIGSVANLCSATLGAGILALPFAFYQSGILCGILLLLVSAWATSVSIGLIVEACDSYGLTTYEKIVERGLGRRSRTIVEVSILVFCIGTAVGYVIAVGDIIERVVSFRDAAQKHAAMSLVWLVAMLPLSCLKTMKSLQCASSVGIISIGTLLVAAIVHLLRRSGGGGDGGSALDAVVDPRIVGDGDDGFGYSFAMGENGDDSRFLGMSFRRSSIVSLLYPAGGSWWSVLQACPIIVYAFTCQVNVAQIFEELPGIHGNNPQKTKAMGRVTLMGVLVCSLLYVSVSLVTLIDFGESVTPNILSCYDLGGKGQPLLHVAFLGMALAVVMAFPLNIFPVRVSLIQLWEDHQQKGQRHREQHESTEHESSLSSPSSSPMEPDIEGIGQPLLSKEAPSRSADYNSGREAEGEDNDNGEEEEEDPLRSQTNSLVVSPDHRTSDGNDHYDDEGTTAEFRFVQHALVTLVLAGMSLGMALVIPNISVVFGLLGGTTSSILGFVVPGLLGLQLDKRRVGAWVLVVCGSIIGVLATVVTVYSVVHPS